MSSTNNLWTPSQPRDSSPPGRHPESRIRRRSEGSPQAKETHTHPPTTPLPHRQVLTPTPNSLSPWTSGPVDRRTTRREDGGHDATSTVRPPSRHNSDSRSRLKRKQQGGTVSPVHRPEPEGLLSVPTRPASLTTHVRPSRRRKETAAPRHSRQEGTGVWRNTNKSKLYKKKAILRLNFY